MGKALYRTYRSKSFDEVVGQEHITKTLKNAVKKDAIAHAYLFTGPRGVGKTSVARILAHAVNDLPYTSESTHLDIIEIDAASNRRIDEIRDLRDKVHIAPTSVRFKVYIIDEVHMLTREAFNALLKTLEEPPAHAIFILATTEAHKVPDTIISRTQRFHFKPIAPEAVTQHLAHIADKEGINITKKGLALLARHGRGSFRDSISLLDQLAGLNKKTLDEHDVNFLLGIADQELIDAIIESVRLNSTAQLFEHITAAREQGIDPGQLAKSISQTIRDQLVHNKSTLRGEQSVAILKSLLTSSITNDFIGLELALLENMSHNQNRPTPVLNPTSVPPAGNEQNHPTNPINNAEPEKKSIDPQTADIIDTPSDKGSQTQSWPDLLANMKGHHNTLYGVLRMADAEVNSSEVKLTFRFAFHKQQVDAPQNKKILHNYVKQHFGKISITTHLARAETDKKQTIGSEGTDPIATVSSIFGAAELLE